MIMLDHGLDGLVWVGTVMRKKERHREREREREREWMNLFLSFLTQEWVGIISISISISNFALTGKINPPAP